MSALPNPRSKLTALSVEERAAVAAALHGEGDSGLLWLDKLRRFSSLYGRNLRSEAGRRFGGAASEQLSWMAQCLLDGASRCPERGQAPCDAATLSAALFCIDACANPSDLQQQAQQAVDSLGGWLATGASQPPQTPALGVPFAPQPAVWAKEAPHTGRLVILAPSPYSLYALAILELCRHFGVPVHAVVLRKFTVRRFASEWHRDGPRLLKKIWRKLILRGDENAAETAVSLTSLLAGLEPEARDVRKRGRELGAQVFEVDDFADVAGALSALRPGLALFTGGGLIGAPVIELFAGGIINVHMGHLPQYKGMDVVQAPLLEGRLASVGLTAHLMAPALDAGPVVTRFSAEPTCYGSLGALRNALSAVMPLMMFDAMLGLFAGRYSPARQPAAGRQYYFVHPALMPAIENAFSGVRSRGVVPARDPVMEVVEGALAGLPGSAPGPEGLQPPRIEMVAPQSNS